MIARSRSLLFTLLALVLFTSASRAADPNKIKRYVRALKASLLVVTPASKSSNFQGTGVLVEARRRLVITNYHVVQDKTDVLLYFPTFVGRRLLTARDVYSKVISRRQGLRGKVLARDKTRDLALIQMAQIPRGVLSLRLAKDSPKSEERVHSIGNPGKSKDLWIYTTRKVEKVGRAKFTSTGGAGSNLRMEVNAKMIFTDTPSRQGESGGPLFNDKAELVGITQGFIPSSGTGLYVDVTELRAFLTELGYIKKKPVAASSKIK